MCKEKKSLSLAKQEMEHVLRDKIIPFWSMRSIDQTYGGYLVSFDENGKPLEENEKYIVTQTRMIWGFSHLSRYADEKMRAQLRDYAEQGLRFFISHFWDKQLGGFFWKVSREGDMVDGAKLVYGQSFAIYALSEYYLCYRDQTALKYAEKTFDLLQVYAADTLYGGYFENIERDWTISPGGFYAGDRKSLDIHMHLMEAFTTLYEATGKEIHRRKLLEVTDLIINHMVNRENGYGYNQFNRSFLQIPAININRTWNAERETNESIDTPTDTTSYGHNVELSWLLDKAVRVTGADNSQYSPIVKKLLDHSLKYGYDYEYGGVYRDGIADQQVLVTDKEWWQNFESLVGYINGYKKFEDTAYLEAFCRTWEFVKTHFLNMDVGESRQLLDRSGNVLVGNMGNPWKGIYHTGRALAECLDKIGKYDNPSYDSKYTD